MCGRNQLNGRAYGAFSKAALAILAGISTMTFTSTAAVHQSIAVYHIDEHLAHRPPNVWRVDEGVPIRPLFVAPGSNEIVALVRVPPNDQLLLKRWSTEGNPLSSRLLDVTGPIRGSFLGADGYLTLVTSAELLRLHIASDEQPTRQRLPNATSGNAYVVVGGSGAWFDLKERLVRVGIDGTTFDVKLPLYVVPRNGENSGSEGMPRTYVDGRTLVATIDGGCLVLESVMHELQVTGTHVLDRVTTYALTSLTQTGQVRAQTTRGEVTSTWEWFWSTKSRSNPTIFPEKFGLVRNRYRGTEHISSIHERANGDVLIFAHNPGKAIRIDRTFRPLWSTFIDEPSIDDVVSHPWTRSVLYTRGDRFTVIDEAGESKRNGYYYDAKAMKREDRSLPQIAVGQSRSGEWLIVEY